MDYFLWGYVLLEFFNSSTPESTESIIGSTIALATLGFFFFLIMNPSDYEKSEQAFCSLKGAGQEKFRQAYLKKHKIR